MMNYAPHIMTERIIKLKEQYSSLPVPAETNAYKPKRYRTFCTGDRWITLGYLRGWLKHSDAATTRLRNSYAEAEELCEAHPIIYDNELLLGHLYLPEYSVEEQLEYDRLCDSFAMSSYTLKERAPRKDHLSLDLDQLIKKGICGIKKEIIENRNRLNFEVDIYPDYEVLKKKEFYDCCLIELDAVLSYADHYRREVKKQAGKVAEPRKSELHTLEKILERVPEWPANTFYEALQSIQIFLSTLFGLYPLGRPDRYLYPYYRNDIENGSLSKEFAQELIDNFCLCVSDRVFSRAACGFIVGGQDENGNLVENDLTYMFLTSLDHLRLPDPNGALAVNEKTSDEVLGYATEVLSHGTTHPAFYNDNAIIQSLERHYGVERSDAVNYIHTTCAEISVAGKSRAHTTSCIVDLPRLLSRVIDSNTSCSNIELIMELLISRIREYISEKTLEYGVRMLEASRIGNEPMRVCTLIDNCVQSGKGIYEGGEKYTFIQPIFVGFSTVVDSLVAIDELVYGKGKYTLGGLHEIVANNYKDQEVLRSYIIHKIPHYGNDEERPDELAAALAGKLEQLFTSDTNRLPFSKYYIPGTFSYMTHAALGQQMGATFDGRLAGYSYSDGCGPVQGRDRNGPTAMINSLTSWDQCEFLGGMVVNMKFSADNLDGRKRENFIQLLRTFISRGGIEMQVNVVDRKTLVDAQKNPQAYTNLLVRIGGYSDYFVRLNPTLQQEIIDRTEY